MAEATSFSSHDQHSLLQANQKLQVNHFANLHKSGIHLEEEEEEGGETAAVKGRQDIAGWLGKPAEKSGFRVRNGVE